MRSSFPALRAIEVAAPSFAVRVAAAFVHDVPGIESAPNECFAGGGSIGGSKAMKLSRSVTLGHSLVDPIRRPLQ
jgi:hypothetical protein